MASRTEKPEPLVLPGAILLDGNTYKTKVVVGPDGRIHNACTREPFTEYASAIREGEQRRVDRLVADFREEGGRQGYPLGLGHKFTPGGIWKGELLCHKNRQITLPLEMESAALALGNLSGEVAAAGRLISCNSSVGTSSGKKRLLAAIGAQLFGSTSDTDFTPVLLTTSGLPAGQDRYYCMAEVIMNNSRVVALGGENPTAAIDSALNYTTDVGAATVAFAEWGGAGTSDIDECYWIVSIDSQERTYAHIRINSAGAWGLATGEWLVYWAYSDAFTAAPTIVLPVNRLKKGDQIAGVIGNRIYLIEPDADAQTNPNMSMNLMYFNVTTQKLVDVSIGTRSIVLACRYTHPILGVGICYSDMKQVRFIRDSDLHDFDLDWQGPEGRDVACEIRGLYENGGRLGVWIQSTSYASGWFELYIPNPVDPKGNQSYGAWYPYSKRVTTTVATVLPGGTIRGTTLPWGAEGLRHYVVEPSATNSTVWKQLAQNFDFNPLIDNLNVDDFEDGPLDLDTPLFDNWGGPEEPGVILQGYLEGSDLSATETAQWFYSTDLSTYTQFAAAQTAVDQMLNLATGGVSARRFATRCRLDRGATATKTPNGAPFIVRGYKEPQTRWLHTIPVDVDGMDDTQRRELYDRFGTSRDASTAVRLEYSGYDVYVYVLGGIVNFAPALPYTARERILALTLRLLEAT